MQNDLSNFAVFMKEVDEEIQLFFTADVFVSRITKWLKLYAHNNKLYSHNFVGQSGNQP